MDRIRDAFQRALRDCEPERQEGEDQSLLPLSKISDALDGLGLDGQDDFVLDLFRETAAPLFPGRSRGAGAREQGVPLDQFAKVCEVLLASQAPEGEVTGSPNQQADPERRRRRKARPASIGSLESGSDYGAEMDGDSDEDDYEEVESDDGEGGGFTLKSQRGSGRLTEKDIKDAKALFELLKSRTSRKGGNGSLTFNDLREIAANVGEKLSERDAQEMIDEAVRLHKLQNTDARAQTSSSIGVEQLAAVLRRGKR